MSQAGVFNLVVQDERNDKLFTATKQLSDRLSRVRACRQKAGASNPQPTFADIEKTHILYVRSWYRPYVAIASEYIRVQPTGGAVTLGATGGTVDFTPPVHGNFTSDMVFHIRVPALGTQTPAESDPYYRYCAYPGMRIISKAEFSSDSVVIGEYTTDETSFANKFGVAPARRDAWDRGMGQAALQAAEYYNNNGYTGVINYRDGLQTPKQYHPATDLWVPAQFFMNHDASHALLNDLIPNTQRKVTITLAQLSQIVYAYEPDNDPNGFPLKATANPLESITLGVSLYVNNLFVNPDINDVFASRVGFSLIRLYKKQTKMLSIASDKYLLNRLKYPLESMCVGVRATAQATDPDQWHLYGRPTTFTDSSRITAAAAQWAEDRGAVHIVARHATPVSTLNPILDTLSFTAHGIDLFPASMPVSFYSDYLPQRYAARTAVKSSSDTSAYFVPFCLYPGQFNPSGYYNMSVAREFYINYSASPSEISASNQVELVVSAVVLNFLVRRGDSVTLRYAL